MPKINPAEFLSTLSPEALEYVKAGGGDAGKEAIANMTKDSSKNLQRFFNGENILSCSTG